MQEQSDINFRMPTISMGGLFSFAVELLLFILFYKVYMENYYQTVLMRGATRGTFILPRLVCDLAVCFVFFHWLGRTSFHLILRNCWCWRGCSAVGMVLSGFRRGCCWGRRS